MVAGRKEFVKKFDINDWTLIDFDNCLEGNPHTVSDVEHEQKEESK